MENTFLITLINKRDKTVIRNIIAGERLVICKQTLSFIQFMRTEFNIPFSAKISKVKAIKPKI